MNLFFPKQSNRRNRVDRLVKRAKSYVSAKPAWWIPWLVWLGGWALLSQAIYALVSPPPSQVALPESQLVFLGQFSGGVSLLLSSLIAFNLGDGGWGSAGRFILGVVFIGSFTWAFANVLGAIREITAPVQDMNRSDRFELFAALTLIAGAVDCLVRFSKNASGVSGTRIALWGAAVVVCFAASLSPEGYYRRTGAICEDGTFSPATGSGACSWHGGVREWLQEFIQTDQ